MEEMLRQLLEGQKQLFEKVSSIDNRLGKVEANMATKQDVIHMENTMTEKFGGLYDAREVQFDVNDKISDSLNRIEKTINRMSLRVNQQGSMIVKAK